MRSARRSAGRGAAAAFRTRRVVGGPALQALLVAPNPCVAGDARADVTARAHRATDAAFTALRLLAWLPGWRHTCLYRAVAECLVLRGLGMPAVVRLGVARAAGPVAAHAWVECAGHRCRASDGQETVTYAPLYRPAPCRTPGAPA